MDAHHRKAWFAGALGVSLVLAACGSHSTEVGGGGSSAPAQKPLPGTKSAAIAGLVRADSCGDLLDQIKADVIAKIDAQAILLRDPENQSGQWRGGGGVTIGGVPSDGSAEGPVFGNAGGAGTGGSALPPTQGTPGEVQGGTTDGKGTTGGGGSGAPTGHSDTNTQVEGVDEADIVKTDGEKIYLIHGNTLFRLTSWPPESTSIDDQAPIEGGAGELFVANGKAVVFSTLWNQGDIVALDGKGSSYAGGAYYQPYYYGAPFTKITTLDVSGGKPVVERELYVEGSYLSARRHGDTVRAIVQGGFHTPPVFQAYIEYTDPWGEPYPQEDIDAQVDAWRDRMIASIEKTTVEDWVPVERERIDGELVKAQPRCVDFYAPPPALTSYGLTNVVSFDITDPKSEIGGAIVLGNADTVYANQDTLVLAQRDWRYDQGFLQREQTVLHTFALSAERTSYRASGFVPGHILNQFSLDVLGETLRVAVTQNIWQDFVELVPLKTNVGDVPMASTRMQTDNRVVTLQANGETLERVGITPPLGADGERIESARFLGERAYVTTFRTVDPLTAIDLSDPKDPTILGELHIPGFSEYMHPLGKDHLLTIGRNTDVNGSDTGLLLQIFDVSDPVTPTLAHKFAFEPSGWSEASNNHKAFNYWVPEGETDGLLAIPYVNYTQGFGSSLQVFRVSTGKGFTQLGEIDHTPFFSVCYDQFGAPTADYYGYYYCQQPEVRRGLFVEDADEVYVYSISYAGVLVHALSDLVTPLASVTLPAPDYSEHRVGEVLPTTSGGGSPGSMGSTGAAGAGATDTKPAVDPAPAADGGMADPAG